MEEQELNLPLSTVAMVFGALSIPLAFAVHLVSLALVLGVLAVVIGLWGRMQVKRSSKYTTSSVQRGQRGLRLGTIGIGCALIMWVLWATNTLL